MTARAQKEYMDFCMLKQACIDYGKEEGKAEGIAIGKEEGRNEAKLEAARNMLSQGVNTDKIATWLDLPLEKVCELAEKLQAKA